MGPPPGGSDTIGLLRVMAPSSQIAHYKIVSKLGEGGMGAVYRAIDTKLNREVAVKVLPDSFAGDPERVARFTREAQVLAALNHPNIAAIYGVEERALVMELVEGENLPAPLPLEAALDYARQIAEALEAAHEKGIVHRDLKPANIRVTPAGTIKVLDFGLAAVMSRAGQTNASASISPTLTAAATHHGMILGTASYMSPEQAAGKPVDKRADIWSFGVVLWEMLSGQRLFEGETVSHTLAAVLRAEIDLSKLPESTPEPIRDLLGRCLDRNLKSRLRDIGEARIAIERWIANPVAKAAVSGDAARRSSALTWGLSGVALILLAAVGYLASKPAPIPEPIRLELNLPPGVPAQFPAISPDGRNIAFLGGESGKTKLWLRPLDGAAAHPLEGTEGGASPFWSPDSRYLGYFTRGDRPQMKKIAVSGGAPQLVCDLPAGLASFASWGRGGVILIPTAGGVMSRAAGKGGLYRVSQNGGPVTEATLLEGSGGNHRWPFFLPDGRHFLFLNLGHESKPGIYLGSLDSKEVTQVNSEISGAVYASGYLLFVRDQTLVAQPFDPESRKLSGEAVPVFDNIRFAPPIWLGAFSVSAKGHLLAVATKPREMRRLTWFDRGGKVLGTLGEPSDLSNHRLSPDGKKVAMLRGTTGKALALWVLDVERGVFSALTKEDLSDHGAGIAFSPDSERIAFSGIASRMAEIHAIPAGGGAESGLVEQGASVSDWSRDGQYVAYRRGDLSVQQVGSGEPIHFRDGAANGRFSPDGKWLAYTAMVGQRPEVFVEPFSGVPSNGTGRIQVSPTGGKWPVWSRDGKELFYLAGTKLMATPVWPVGIPKALFDVPGGATFEVSDDGKRFLLDVQVGQQADPPISVLLNWPSTLKR